MPKRKLRGAGFFDTLSKGFNFLKNNKVLSTVANLAKVIPHAGVQKYAGTAGNLLGSIGMGKKRVRKVAVKKPKKGGFLGALIPMLLPTVMKLLGGGKHKKGGLRTTRGAAKKVIVF